MPSSSSSWAKLHSCRPHRVPDDPAEAFVSAVSLTQTVERKAHHGSLQALVCLIAFFDAENEERVTADLAKQTVYADAEPI